MIITSVDFVDLLLYGPPKNYDFSLSFKQQQQQKEMGEKNRLINVNLLLMAGNNEKKVINHKTHT